MSAVADSAGKYQMVFWPEPEPYELSAAWNEKGTWQSGIRFSQVERRVLNLTLMKASSISGTLFAYDNTFHKSVSVQAVRIDKSTGQQQVVATTLSNETGNYRFTHLKPGRYLVRCYTGNYVYYAQSERATDEAVGDILLVEARKALEEIDFQFAPFKKGVWRTHNYLDGLASDRVYAIASDATEAMWFGTHDGVSRYDGRSFVNFTRRDELAGNQITSIHRDDDALWLGLPGAEYPGTTVRIW